MDPPLDSDTKSCPPQLAQEIIDEIIDTFSACNHRAAIVPLTTVARGWRPRSQRQLFHTHTLMISDETLQKALEDTRTCSPAIVFSYVRVLLLHRPDTGIGLGDGAWLLRLFTNVVQLKLRNLSFRGVTLDQATRTFGHFGRTVRRLHLAEVRLKAKMLMHLVAWFPIADDIEVHAGLPRDVGLIPVEEPVIRKFQGRLLLDCLRGFHGDFLDFISAGSPSFDTLTVAYCRECEDQIARLIRACGDSLKTFQYSTGRSGKFIFGL